MIIPLRAGLRAAIKRNVTIRNTGWPYNTPIYTGIPPVFSCIGAAPEGAPPMVRNMIRQYEASVQTDRDLHRQGERERNKKRKHEIDEHRRQVRARGDDLYRKILQAGWVNAGVLGWRPRQAKHR